MINGWVSEETHGRIPKIMETIGPSEVLVLTNAVYFKAPWVRAFDPERTREVPFNLADGSLKSVPMMTRHGKVRLFSTDRFAAADLRYGSGAYSMTIVVPRGDETVASVIGSLDAKQWAGWLQKFDDYGDGVVSLPRFHLEYEIRMDSVLMALGMGIVFNGAANFSGISDVAVSLSRVEQKTFLKVNEEGTEAAAATNVGFDISGRPGVTADRPFLLVIRERLSGTILFIGQIMNPAAD